LVRLLEARVRLVSFGCENGTGRPTLPHNWGYTRLRQGVLQGDAPAQHALRHSRPLQEDLLAARATKTFITLGRLVPAMRLYLLAVATLLALLSAAPAETSAPWRGVGETPGYAPWSPDPWEWRRREAEIWTVGVMYFGETWRGWRPLFNFYISGEGCRDPEALAVYRREILESIELLKAYRDWFVNNYPQFGYLGKLQLQLSNTTIEKAYNIKIDITAGCAAHGASLGWILQRVFLTNPNSALHEFIHAIGAGEIYLGDSPYYSFYTPWGFTGNIGMNTLTWYALALSWSWLAFHDEHPGAAGADYASKLPTKLKYTVKSVGSRDMGVEIYSYRVTARDMMESGVVPRPARGLAELRLGGGAVIPVLSLWPEEWMVGHPQLDYVDPTVSTINGKVYWSVVGRSQAEVALSKGYAIGYWSFSRTNPLDYQGQESLRERWSIGEVTLIDLIGTLLVWDRPWADPSSLEFLFFTDLRPDLHFCGFVYRWRGSQEDRVVPIHLIGNESFWPSLRPGERLTYYVNCYYLWGPYAYRAPSILFQEVPLAARRDVRGRELPDGLMVVLGVPAVERVLQDSPTSRRVFTGRWLVNGSEWPGPYLDLDVLGWRVSGSPPERPSKVRGVGSFTFSLRVHNYGQPMYLDGFLSRYGGFVREPWMLGVTVLKLRHNTTAEPIYASEHFINFTIPQGFKLLEGDRPGWYGEGATITLPRLSNVTLSEGTALVHEGWRSSSGRLYAPGEEYVVSGPEAFEPVMARYHRVSVRAPEGARISGEGWYREGSEASVRVLENVTYVGERTRIVVHGIRLGGEVVEEARLTVNGPVELEAVWERQHILRVLSRFYEWGFSDYWYTENATYMMVLPGEPRDLGNGTMIEIRAAHIATGGKIYAGEPLQLYALNLTVGGAPVERLWNLTFTVHGPPDLVVEWGVRYAVEIEAPPGLATIRGLEEYGAPITVYAEEGEELVIELLPEALAGEARYLLHEVRVGDRSLGRETELRLRVSGPISVSASYRLQLLVWPRLLGGDGSVAEPDLVVLTSPLGEASSEGGSALWLDSVLTGNGTVGWRLVKAVYRGVDVTLEQVLTPYEPGALYVRAPLSHLRVSVRDLVGMPVPMALVTYRGPGGFTATATANMAGAADLGVVPHGEAWVEALQLLRAGRAVLVPEEAAVLTLPISPYTAAIAAAAALAAYWVVFRWRRGR